jgi:hypothetical protein
MTMTMMTMTMKMTTMTMRRWNRHDVAAVKEARPENNLARHDVMQLWAFAERCALAP